MGEVCGRAVGVGGCVRSSVESTGIVLTAGGSGVLSFC